MDRYEEIEKLANEIQEIRKDYTDRNKTWQHQFRPNLKGGLNTYLAIKLYDKGYRQQGSKMIKQMNISPSLNEIPDETINLMIETYKLKESKILEKSIRTNLLNEIISSNKERLVTQYCINNDPFWKTATKLFLMGFKDYLVKNKYDSVTFKDCEEILCSEKLKKYLIENHNNAGFLQKKCYRMVAEIIVYKILASIFSIDIL